MRGQQRNGAALLRRFFGHAGAAPRGLHEAVANREHASVGRARWHRLAARLAVLLDDPLLAVAAQHVVTVLRQERHGAALLLGFGGDAGPAPRGRDEAVTDRRLSPSATAARPTRGVAAGAAAAPVASRTSRAARTRLAGRARSACGSARARRATHRPAAARRAGARAAAAPQRIQSWIGLHATTGQQQDHGKAHTAHARCRCKRWTRGDRAPIISQNCERTGSRQPPVGSAGWPAASSARALHRLGDLPAWLRCSSVPPAGRASPIQGSAPRTARRSRTHRAIRSWARPSAAIA